MLIHVGMGSYIERDQVLAVVKADSNPVRRLIQAADDRGCVVDATWGKCTRSVVVMPGGVLVLSMLEPETLVRRSSGNSCCEVAE